MTAPPSAAPAPRDEAELEDRLSTPTAGAMTALEQCPGDVLVLGAGGKMGPSLARMLRRAADSLGDGRRVIAVSRWSSPDAERLLNAVGVETRRCDLLDRAGVAALPDAPNVVFMAGQKFGTSEAAHRTWAMNTIAPVVCAERYAGARTVAFSTGNVYALSPVGAPGGPPPRMSQEGDALAPVGEYAASCVGRERVFEHFAAERGTPVSIVRLNYAVDLRYGVLVDLARRVWAGEPVDVTMGYVNAIWQGDANALAIAALAHAASPPFVVNVTGPLRLAVREVAHDLGALLGRTPVITGTEAPDALLSDTARMRTALGEVTVEYWTLVTWVAEWVKHGGRVLGKPTKFEVRDGKF